MATAEWEPWRAVVDAQAVQVAGQPPAVPALPAETLASPTESDDEDVPRMPVAPCTYEHRERVPLHELPYSALVARAVGKAEARGSPEAQAALLSEWARLRAAGVWDESKVCEWDEVTSRAKKAGKKGHVGLIF